MFSIGSYKTGCILLAGLFIYDIFWVFGTDAIIAKITGKTGDGVMVTVAKNFDAPIKILFPREWGAIGEALEQCTKELHANITSTLYNTSITDMPAAMGKLGIKNETAQPLIQAAADSAQSLTDAIGEAAPKLAKLCTENKMSMLGLGDIVIPGIFVALLLRFDHAQARKHNRAMNKTSFNYTFVGYVAGLALTVFIMVVFEAAQPALLYLVPGCIGMSLVAGMVQGNVPDMWAYSEEEEEEKDEAKKE
jgi:presenilin-like A22 family membrane protease